MNCTFKLCLPLKPYNKNSASFTNLSDAVTVALVGNNTLRLYINRDCSSKITDSNKLVTLTDTYHSAEMTILKFHMPLEQKSPKYVISLYRSI